MLEQVSGIRKCLDVILNLFKGACRGRLGVPNLIAGRQQLCPDVVSNIVRNAGRQLRGKNVQNRIAMPSLNEDEM